MKELKLIPPNDPRVQTAVYPFKDEMLKDEGFETRKELVDAMFETMNKYHGIGLSSNQVGLPFNMFVMGGHPQIEKGLKMACFNPMIISSGEEDIMMKEGCLTYPFLFLSIKRPRKIVGKYEDENGELKEAHMDGMLSRNFTEKASKLKLDMARKKAIKIMDQLKAQQDAKKS